MTRGEVLRLAKLLATPVDLEGLVARGVLKRRGAWYETLDIRRLPEHAGHHMTEIKSETKRGAKPTLLVKFRSQSRARRHG